MERPSGRSIGFGGETVFGYEIRHGRVSVSGGEPLFSAERVGEGCRAGATLGTSWHGVLECDGFRRALLGWVAAERTLDWKPGGEPFAAARERRFETLADLVAENVDREALLRMIDGGAKYDLPVIRSQLSAVSAQAGNRASVG